MAHDGLPGGIIRQDVLWSNYYVQPGYGWANGPAATDWMWQLIYEHPLWTTKEIWQDQQKAARDHRMPISTAAQDAFALNMVLAVTGIRFRVETWSRTSTVVDGYPLHVYSHQYGVFVRQRWFPEGAAGHIAVSVQGVPGDFEP